MSTALIPHQRSHLIAAAAAILAVVTLGVGVEIARDNAPASPSQQSVTTTVPQFKLTGGTHEQGNWQHAGTTSGGHVPPQPTL